MIAIDLVPTLDYLKLVGAKTFSCKRVLTKSQRVLTKSCLCN